MTNDFYAFSGPVKHVGIDNPSTEFMAAQIAFWAGLEFSFSTGRIVNPDDDYMTFENFAEFVDFCERNGFFLYDRSGVNWSVVEKFQPE